METKVCSKCGRELPTSEFYRNANTKDGLGMNGFSTREKAREAGEKKLKELEERK